MSILMLSLSQDADAHSQLQKFYERLYAPQFPDPDERESLANMIDSLTRQNDGRNCYHIALALDGDKPIGGCIMDYFERPNAGAFEFIVIDPVQRGRGLGSKLLEFSEELLREDAKKLGRTLDFIAAEMEDPYLFTDLEHATIDPFERSKIHSKWGFQKIRFPYVQPALSVAQQPHDKLLLMAKVFKDEYKHGISGKVVDSFVHEYIRLAMRRDDPLDEPAYLRMHDFLSNRDTIPLIPLDQYVVLKPPVPLVVTEVVSPDDPALEGIANAYRMSFPPSETAVDPGVFRSAIASKRHLDKEHRWHLWALRADATKDVEGMASFFTFPRAGFGGYVALTGSLKGKGLLPHLIGLREKQMIKDQLDAHGWYIECDLDGPLRGIFERHGFRLVKLDYAQPPLANQPSYALANAPRLALMYKPFGDHYGPRGPLPEIKASEFKNAITWIFRVIYRIEDASTNEFFSYLTDQLNPNDKLIPFTQPE